MTKKIDNKLAEFRALLASKVPPNVSVVDELLAERRIEAQQEMMETERDSRTGHAAASPPKQRDQLFLCRNRMAIAFGSLSDTL